MPLDQTFEVTLVHTTIMSGRSALFPPGRKSIERPPLVHS
jgi:hypothetical protein